MTDFFKHSKNFILEQLLLIAYQFFIFQKARIFKNTKNSFISLLLIDDDKP